MKDHHLPCSTIHAHPDDEERRVCEAEHAELMRRLADRELTYCHKEN